MTKLEYRVWTWIFACAAIAILVIALSGCDRKEACIDNVLYYRDAPTEPWVRYGGTEPTYCKAADVSQSHE